MARRQPSHRGRARSTPLERPQCAQAVRGRLLGLRDPGGSRLHSGARYPGPICKRSTVCWPNCRSCGWQCWLLHRSSFTPAPATLSSVRSRSRGRFDGLRHRRNHSANRSRRRRCARSCAAAHWKLVRRLLGSPPHGERAGYIRPSRGDDHRARDRCRLVRGTRLGCSQCPLRRHGPPLVAQLSDGVTGFFSLAAIFTYAGPAWTEYQRGLATTSPGAAADGPDVQGHGLSVT